MKRSEELQTQLCYHNQSGHMDPDEKVYVAPLF